MDYALIEVATGNVLTRVFVDDDQETYDPGEGLIAVPVTAEQVAYAGCLWSEEEGFVEPVRPPPPAPISQDVNAERDRRIATGFSFGGAAFQLDEVSISRVAAMGADARFAVLGGAQAGNLRWADPDNDFGWIATDNTIVSMDAPAMTGFADAAKLWVARNTFAARALKDLDPIPADFAINPAYWP